jgi:hypothetical protein
MKNTLFTVVLSFSLTSVLAQEQKYNIYFEPGQKTMADKQKKSINEIAAQLTEGTNVIFYPLAYDSINDIYRYTANAREQASAIAAYAATVGFELKGIPRNFPSSYSGLSYSVIMKYSKPAVPGDKPGLAQLPKGIKDHYPEKPSQYFLIDPLRDTMIVGNEGTKLLFKGGSLLSNKKVQIELKEFYRLEDYIKSGLPTVSNGVMIQTGGSIYLNARENDAGKRQVPINPQVGVGVDFTLGKTDTAMQIFIKDPRSPNQLNWILPPKTTKRESFKATEIVYGPDNEIISKKQFNSKEEWEQHLKDEEEKEKEIQKKAAIRQETNNKMDSKLQIYNLGYINCDKFYNEPLMVLTVPADQKVSAEYYLVYTDIRGVMKGEVNGQSVNFSSVAKNRRAVLIAVCFIDKQAYYFKGMVGPGGKLESKVALLPVEESFLNQQLALLK